MNKKMFTGLKILLGIVIIFLMIYKVGLAKIISTFEGFNWLYLVPIIIIALSSILLGVFNIWILLKPLKVKIPIMKLTNYYLSSWALGLVSPGKVGEFSIAYFFKKYDITLGESFALSIMDKLITVVSLLGFSLLGLFAFFNFEQSLQILGYVAVFGVVGLFFIFSRLGRNIIRKLLPSKIKKSFKGFSKLLLDYLKHHKLLLLVNFLITCIKWVIGFFGFYVTLFAFGYSIPFHLVFSVLAISKIISLIPLTISGLGIKEASSVYLFANSGYNTGIVVGSLLISLLVNYLFALIIVVIAKQK